MVIIKLIQTNKIVMLDLKWIRMLLLALLVSASLLSCYMQPAVKILPEGPLSGKKIMLDPGHGVRNSKGEILNPGMIGPGGITEREAVVQVAELLGQRLESVGCEVFYTRTSDRSWRVYEDVRGDNYNRSFEARDHDVDAFIKLHIDWFKDKSVSGTRTFYFKRDSKKLAQAVHTNLVRTIKRPDRGIERDWFVGMEVAKMPVILVEICFLSNRQEALLLKDSRFLHNSAEGIFRGILTYFSGVKS